MIWRVEGSVNLCISGGWRVLKSIFFNLHVWIPSSSEGFFQGLILIGRLQLIWRAFDCKYRDIPILFWILLVFEDLITAERDSRGKCRLIRVEIG